MIDFHSHILPKLDDGSKSTDMSLEMLSKSFDYGIDVMVATPHFYIKHNTVDNFISQRSASYNALMGKVKAYGTDLPDIVLGAEVYYFDSLCALPDIEKLCIADTKYLLLEMPFAPWTSKMVGTVEKLVYDCGITPVMAHIDRYLEFQKHNSYIDDIIGLGAVIQMNGEYINGFFTRGSALKLIKNGTVSLLGSDCHNLDTRAPNLDKSFRIIRDKCGQKTLDKIDACGREILGI